jgi:hypothetical protein
VITAYHSVRDHADLGECYTDLRTRYSDRDGRHADVYRVLNREWGLVDSTGDPLDIVSYNMILTALEDISEAAATMPTVRVRPAKTTKQAADESYKMTRIAVAYATANKIRATMPRFIMDHLAYGLCAWVVLPSRDEMRPVIYRRNARTCYPDMPLRPSMIPDRVMFCEEVAAETLDPETKAMLVASGYQDPRYTSGAVVRIEYITADQYVVGYGFGSGSNLYGRERENLGANTYVVTEVADLETDHTPVVIMARDTFDDQHRGLFDHVLDPQLAHAKLLAMAIDYADQAVYSDIWARDVLGDTSWGGQAYIELGPNGAIGRVPPAATGIDLWRDVDKLEEGIHTGARWPKSRMGQVDQAIASGKFVEATVGTMNTVLKVVHEKVSEALETILHLCFQTDLAYYPDTETTARGRIHGEDYMVDYVPSRDINLDHDIDVEYGLGLGRDSSESAVLMLQYAERDLLSDEFVRENTEGLTDIGRERQRVDMEKLEKMMFAALLQGVEQGEYPKEILPDIYKRRAEGDALAEILADVFAPAEPPPGMVPEGQMAALAAAGLPPGMPPPPPGGPGAAVLPPGMAPEVSPPVPPNPNQLLARMNIGPGGPVPTLGAQTQMVG